MNNKPLKIVFVVVGVLILMILLMIAFKRFDNFIIQNPTGEDSFYLINVINCTELQLKNESFLIPLAFVDRKRVFYEQSDATHAKGCWYDTILIDDLTLDWLDENCMEQPANLFRKKYQCDKGFLVSVS